MDFEFKVTNIDANDPCTEEYVILQCGMLLSNQRRKIKLEVHF